MSSEEEQRASTSAHLQDLIQDIFKDLNHAQQSLTFYGLDDFAEAKKSISTRIQCYVSTLKAVCDQIDSMQREIDELAASPKIHPLTKDQAVQVPDDHSMERTSASSASSKAAPVNRCSVCSKHLDLTDLNSAPVCMCPGAHPLCHPCLWKTDQCPLCQATISPDRPLFYIKRLASQVANKPDADVNEEEKAQDAVPTMMSQQQQHVQPQPLLQPQMQLQLQQQQQQPCIPQEQVLFQPPSGEKFVQAPLVNLAPPVPPPPPSNVLSHQFSYPPPAPVIPSHAYMVCPQPALMQHQNLVMPPNASVSTSVAISGHYVGQN